MLTLVDDGLIYKTASDNHHCPGAARKGVTLVPRDRVRNQSKQGANPVVHPQQQSSRTSNASNLLQWRSHRAHEQSQIPRDPLWQHADEQDAVWINKTQVQERTVRVKTHAFKKASNNVICFCCIRVWYSASLTMVWVSQPCHSLSYWISTGCKVKPWESFWEQQRTHPLGPCAIYLTYQPWKQAKGGASQSVSQCGAESLESTPRCCQRTKGV